MIIRFLLFFLLAIKLILPLTGNSQTVFRPGSPFIANYPAKDIGIEGAEFFCAVQDNRGMQYFGNSTGVAEFNGSEWRQIYNANKSVVREMAVDSLGRVFIGASNDFGFLQPDSLGNMRYVSLANPVINQGINFNDVWGVCPSAYGIYFCTNKYVFKYNKKKVSIIPVDFRAQDTYDIDSELYLPTLNGLYKIIDTTLVKVSDKVGFCLTSWKGEERLAFNSKGELVSFNISSSEMNPLEFPVQRLLKEEPPYVMQQIDENSFFVVTLSNKIIILSNNGDIIQLIDRESGLMNGTIYRVDVDGDKNLWVSMSNGVAKVDINYPVLKFGEKQNITSEVLTACHFNGTPYIGTLDGIFYLPPFDLSSPDEHGKFQRIDIPAFECWQLVEYNNRLYALCSEDIWEISGSSAKKVYTFISPDRAWRIGTSDRFPNVFFLGMRGRFIALKLDIGQNENSTKVVDEFQFPEITQKVSKITTDKDGNLWLNTTNSGVYFVRFMDTSLKNYRITLFDEQNGITELNHAKCFKVNNEIILCSLDGILQPKFPEDKTAPDSLTSFIQSSAFGDSINEYIGNLTPINKNKYIVAGNNIYITELNKKEGSFDSRGFERINHDIETISYGNDSVVDICASDGLYNYYINTDNRDYSKPYNVIVSKVVQDGDSTLFGGCFFETSTDSTQIASITQTKKNIPTINYHSKSVTFQVASLFYESPEKTEFQYQLTGYDDKWSKWVTDNKITYTSLPPGKYTFKAKARNIYGTLSDITEFKIVVATPWFLKWWTHVFYILAFGGLLYLFAILYTRKLRKQKEVLQLTVEERTKKIREQANQLQEMNAKLIEVDKFKQGVNNMIVHDMKNPINTIINLGEIGESGDFNKLIEKSLFESIKHAGMQMLNMVSNMLDISKYEDTELPLDLERHELYSISQKAIEQVLFLSNKKNITIENRIATNLSVHADAELIERTFVNILTNAIKFSPNNSNVIIHSADGPNKDFTRIMVSDQGIGIAEDKIQLLFRKFSQVVKYDSDKVKSTGLGLAFCKMAVEAHGGVIGVESELNKGSVFWFTLPPTIKITDKKIEERDVSENEPLNLSEAVKHEIEEALIELRKVRYYEISEIIRILKTIDHNDSNYTKRWKQELLDAVRSGNEIRYKELINERL